MHVYLYIDSTLVHATLKYYEINYILQGTIILESWIDKVINLKKIVSVIALLLLTPSKNSCIQLQY